MEEGFNNGIWNDFFSKDERDLYFSYYDNEYLTILLVGACHTTWLYISAVLQLYLSFMDLFVFLAGLFGQLLGFLIIFKERFREAKTGVKEVEAGIEPRIEQENAGPINSLLF